MQLSNYFSVLIIAYILNLEYRNTKNVVKSELEHTKSLISNVKDSCYIMNLNSKEEFSKVIKTYEEMAKLWNKMEEIFIKENTASRQFYKDLLTNYTISYDERLLKTRVENSDQMVRLSSLISMEIKQQNVRIETLFNLNK